MGWFDRLSGHGAPSELNGNTVLLRMPQPSDFEQWRSLRSESRSFLVPWEPRWTEDELSPGSFRQRLQAQHRAVNSGTAQPFFIFDASRGTLLGGINITNIRHGVAQSGTLGYWVGESHAGRGHMTAALYAILNHARLTLKLHRLEAACLPGNQPSLRLLQRAGFEREGFAKAYLKINGRWEDHVLWGKVM